MRFLSPGVGVDEGETNVVAPGLAVWDRCVKGVTHHNEFLISKFQQLIIPLLTLIRTMNLLPRSSQAFTFSRKNNFYAISLTWCW